MRLDKLNIKLQEAIQDAIGLATEFGQQSLEPEHLIYALIKQENSIIAKVLDKIGVPTFSVLKIIEEELENLKKDLESKKKQWEKGKSIILKIKEIKQTIEELKNEASRFEKLGDLDKVAQIKYGKLIELEQELKKNNEEFNQLRKISGMLRQQVDDEDIAKVISEWTGIPLTKLMEQDIEKLVKMEERLKTKVVRQDEAIQVIANCIRRSRSGLADESRPMGAFIFMGPTGVGKTKLAKTLAWFLFDDEDTVVRIDMSEYMEKFSVSRLIGAPPGYIGYEEGGQLSEKIRRRPYSVILLDEIEKAHPEVFNLLLQILDEGRLTDGGGTTVNFKNTVIIMTSNIGAELIQQQVSIGFKNNREIAAYRDIKDRLLGEVRKVFRPEFLNRIDEIIIFNPLSKDDINFGARPLKRTIQKYIQDPLSLRLLDGSLKEGDKIVADLDTDKIWFLDKLTKP